MFKSQTDSPVKLDTRITDWRRFNHELRLLSEQINRYHHASSTRIHKLTSLHAQRYY